jgi:hypothetical protein
VPGVPGESGEVSLSLGDFWRFGLVPPLLKK